MREILLTSSVLILAVLLLRRAFRDRISRRAQYVLWALVLVRLLVPVSLPGADFSVLSAAEPVGRTVTERLEQREIYRVPLAPSPMGTAPQVTSPAPQIEGGGSPSGEAAAPSGGEEAFSYPVIRERVVTAADLLTVLWLIGIAAMANFSGISFARLLGVISPKTRTSRVITIVDTVTPLSPPSQFVNKTVAIEADVIFTMLLPISSVDSNASNRSKIFSVFSAFLLPSVAIFFIRILLTLV